MTIPQSNATIDDVLTEFLAEQRERLSDRTFQRYEEVVDLLRHSLDGYASNSLNHDERQRWQAESESHEETTFCGVFGPEKIPEHLGEFLGDFMVRKVIAGQELLKASGNVTDKLMRWLANHGYIGDETAEDASEHAREAAQDLPIADRLATLLDEVTERAPQIDPDTIAEEDWIEDYLEITDVEPGKIWFDGSVGPIAVPRKTSDLARPGWSACITAAKIAGRWHLIEVGTVYP